MSKKHFWGHPLPNKIEGGLADDKKRSDFDPKALESGKQVELEHTKDPEIAEEIASDHLTEDPQYYKKLKTIEKNDEADLQKMSQPTLRFPNIKDLPTRPDQEVKTINRNKVYQIPIKDEAYKETFGVDHKFIDQQALENKKLANKMTNKQADPDLSPSQRHMTRRNWEARLHQSTKNSGTRGGYTFKDKNTGTSSAYIYKDPYEVNSDWVREHEAAHHLLNKISHHPQFGDNHRIALVNKLVSMVHPDDYSAIHGNLTIHDRYSDKSPQFNEEVLNHVRDFLTSRYTRETHDDFVKENFPSNYKPIDYNRLKRSWKDITNYAKMLTPAQLKALTEPEGGNMGESIAASQGLEKNIKSFAVGLGMLGALSSHAPVLSVQENQGPVEEKVDDKSFGSQPEDHFLHNVMQVETSGGKNLNHPKINYGIHKGHQAVGRFALMPLTIKEISKRHVITGGNDDELHDLATSHPDTISKKIKKNPELELKVARALARHVIDRHGDNTPNAAFAWKYGHNLKAKNIDPHKRDNDVYIQKFKKLASGQSTMGLEPYRSVASVEKNENVDLNKAPVLLDQDNYTFPRGSYRLASEDAPKMKVKTQPLKSGLFHHVFYDKNKENFIHVLSKHKDFKKRPLSIIRGSKIHHDQHGTIFQAQDTATHPLHQAMGYGTTLKKLAAKFHGKIVSDYILSENESKSWKKVANDPNFKLELAPAAFDFDIDTENRQAYTDSTHVLTYKNNKLAANEGDVLDLNKMSQPSLKFPKLGVEGRQGDNVQVIETPRQKEIFARKATQEFLNPPQGPKYSDQVKNKTRPKEVKRITNALGTKYMGVNIGSQASTLAGKEFSRFEEGDSDFKDKQKAHLEKRNQLIRDYNDQYRKWQEKAMSFKQEDFQDPAKKQEWFEHLKQKPQKPKLPRKPSKPKRGSDKLTNEEKIARGSQIDMVKEHEAMHRTFHLIDQKHGKGTRKKVVHNLLSQFEPETVNALWSWVAARGYSEKSPHFTEELITHARDVLSSPKQRESFKKYLQRQGASQESVDNHVKHLKIGWKKANHYAKHLSSDMLKSEEIDLIKAPYLMDDETSDKIGSNDLDKPYKNDSFIRTNKLANGMYHHFFNNPGYSKHFLSTSQDPHKTEKYVANIGGTKFYNGENRGGLKVSISKVHPKHKGKGYGKLLYLAALAEHGDLESDENLTNRSNAVWNQLEKLGGGHVRVDLAPVSQLDNPFDLIATLSSHRAKADREGLKSLIHAKNDKLAANENIENDLTKS